MPSVNLSYLKYLVQISSDLSQDNKKIIARQMGDVCLEHIEDLVGECLGDPTAATSCRLLRDHMTKVDQQMAGEFQTTIDLIQEITSLLRERNIQGIQGFVERLLVPSPLSYLYQLHLPQDIERVRKIAHPVVRAHVMAVLINRDQIAVKSLSLTKKEMMDIAPFLTYVNVEGAFDKWNQREIHRFLDSLQYVTTLLINSDKVTRLPPLPYCRRLECCGTSISALPEMPLCEILDCRWCRKLMAIPSLPRAFKVNCSGCIALTAIADLSSCIELRCNECTVLRRLPLLPLVRIVSCDGCTVLQFLEGDVFPLCDQFSCNGCLITERLPLLPRCQIVHCANCMALIRLPPLLQCIELDCRWCVALRNMCFLPMCEMLDYSYCDYLDLNTLPARFRPRAPLPFVRVGELVNYEDRQMKGRGG